ncbi:MAG TPA: metallophosphoesterase [Bryobacteraceae bacterium]|nr:metallophosphoesterase [Bryobacteraceae bacterium]
MAFSIIFLIFGLSQLYWAWRGYRFIAARVSSVPWRLAICLPIVVVVWMLYEFNLGSWREPGEPVHLTLRKALLAAPYLWWAASSLIAFFVALLFHLAVLIRNGLRRLLALPKQPAPELESPARRQFLEQAATVATAAPFVAGGYGMLYGRLNLEVTPQPIRLARLPRAFEGFRICQLSDIHIGPFMPAEQIRKYAAIANAQKAEMIVLTGDFVTFDPNTQEAVVDALRDLRAPFGVYGSLGNHDSWAGVEDSITELFRQTGVRMLRGINLPITIGADSLNFIGVDFQSPRRFGPSPPVKPLLGNIEHLVDRDRVNILLSHNPDTFPRAAELGIELSLAGHTHGGQASLEFISPELAPSRLVTPYVAGWFQKPGGQLYVNRGIGTIFVPIRLGAPPEITVYSLTRGGNQDA